MKTFDEQHKNHLAGGRKLAFYLAVFGFNIFHRRFAVEVYFARFGAINFLRLQSGKSHYDFRRRHPRFRHPGLPSKNRRRPRPLYLDVVQADQDGGVPDLLRSILRHQPLPDGRQIAGRRTGRVRSVARRNVAKFADQERAGRFARASGSTTISEIELHSVPRYA